MMRREMAHALIVGTLLSALCLGTQAADIQLARNLAATCANCHGIDGRSVGSVLSLAGQSAQDIVTKLGEFKDGKRPATIMHQIAKGLSDEQVKLVAEYFAQQK